MLARPRDQHRSKLRLVASAAADTGPSPAAFLHGPTPDELRRALEGNQRQWLLRLARYGGELIHRDNGIIWHDGSGEEAAGEIQVPFPRLDAGRAGEQLDGLVARLRSRTPARAARVWLPDLPRPVDLPVRLLARGFTSGFRLCWMRLDLWRLRDVRWGPNGLRIEPAGDERFWRRAIHPYHGEPPEAAPAVRATAAAARALPDRVIPLLAWLDGRPVGAATLHLTTGPLGIAGIYDVGVLAGCRNQGIGKAIIAEACTLAWSAGCEIAGLNATPLGEPVYRRLGFEHAGEGQTWELPAAAADDGPLPKVVAFAEALGRGDVAGLDALASDLPAGAVDDRLTCGLTPMQLAARFGQAAAAEWLLGRGAARDLLTAWDLGWTDQAVRLLAERPVLANALDEEGAAPLHEAARRGDVELASLLLAAGADPTVTDGRYGGTPLGWAEHLGHDEVAVLLRD